MTRHFMICCLILVAVPSYSATAQKDPVPWTPETAPWTTQDVIDSRIDEYAQYALMRMFAGDWPEQKVASDMLSAVKAGELAGIYVVDQQVAALRAKEIGKSWWTVLPKGLDAVCIQKPPSKPALIAFSKEARKDKYRLDTALNNAWHMCANSSWDFRGYRQTLPPKQPRDRSCETEEGFATVRVQVHCSGNPEQAGLVIYRDGSTVGEDSTDENGAYSLSGLEPGLYAVGVDDLLRWFEVTGSCDYWAAFDLCGPYETTKEGHSPQKYYKSNECSRPYSQDLQACRNKYSGKPLRDCQSLPEPDKTNCILSLQYLRESCREDAWSVYQACLNRPEEGDQ